MAKKTTRKDIERYETITRMIKALEEEKDALKALFTEDMKEYGVTDENNPNKTTLYVGKHEVTVNHVHKMAFNQTSFRKAFPGMYNDFKEERIEDRFSTKIPG